MDGQLTLDLSNKLVDVVLVVGLAVVGNREFTVGGERSAVAVGQVVDDDLHDLLLAGAFLEGASIAEVLAELRHLRDGVEPREGRDVGNAQGLGLLRRVGDGSGGGLDLSCVEGRKEDVVSNEGVAGSGGLGWTSGSTGG